jgi:glycerol-3-phosphate acyltransferase PlsY
MIAILLLIGAYLLGGIPFGFLLVKLTTGRDVRQAGSGNIGATNVLRTTGWPIAIVTLLLDIAKGFAAVCLMGRFTGDSPWWTSAAAIAVMAGHAYPIFLHFQGGKAVASFIGAFLYLTPIPLLAALAVFVIVVAAYRYISLGSILAAGTFPFAVWLILHPPWPVVLASLLAGGFIVYRHGPNLQRIRGGNEHRFSFASSRK